MKYPNVRLQSLVLYQRGHARLATDVIIPALGFCSRPATQPSLPSSGGLGKAGGGGGGCGGGGKGRFPTNGHNQTAIYLS